MDPVSQTQASEDLALRGLAVVGWYHSHPTFAPIPSVRDIETQAKFQVTPDVVNGARWGGGGLFQFNGISRVGRKSNLTLVFAPLFLSLLGI